MSDGFPSDWETFPAIAYVENSVYEWTDERNKISMNWTLLSIAASQHGGDDNIAGLASACEVLRIYNN